MSSIWNFVRRRRVALVLAALCAAVPVSGASAAISPTPFLQSSAVPFAFPFGGYHGGGAVVAVGPATGFAPSGCGQIRTSVISATGASEAQSCFDGLSFIAPAIGQINSQVGPTIIGSTILAPVTVSAGAVVNP
jgi:hypothetical protein